MTERAYTKWIAASFLADPDPYNRSVLVLLKRLRAKLPTEEFQAVVQEAQNHLVKNELDGDFFHLLLENEIVECLRGLRRLDVINTVIFLECLGIKDYPKQQDGRLDLSGVDFWPWFFEVLPKSIQKQVWDVTAEMPYG